METNGSTFPSNVLYVISGRALLYWEVLKFRQLLSQITEVLPRKKKMEYF